LFRNAFTGIVVGQNMNNEVTKGEIKESRILGIDFGSKRIGVALSDAKRQFALPLTVVTNTETYFEEIEKIAVDNETKEIVLGESRNYKNEPNDILLSSIEFKKKLEEKGFIVHFEPEFMTSVQAERFQGKTDLLDASAAAIILQSYLDRGEK